MATRLLARVCLFRGVSVDVWCYRFIRAWGVMHVVAGVCPSHCLIHYSTPFTY